jgi:hypothetical protein
MTGVAIAKYVLAKRNISNQISDIHIQKSMKMPAMKVNSTDDGNRLAEAAPEKENVNRNTRLR